MESVYDVEPVNCDAEPVKNAGDYYVEPIKNSSVNDAEPENFDTEPENFDTEPENFDTEPDNFDTEHEDFDTEHEDFDQIESFVEGARNRRRNTKSKSKSKSKSNSKSKSKPKPKPKPKKQAWEFVADALIYISDLPHNISLSIAEAIYWMGTKKRPTIDDNKDYKTLSGLANVARPKSMGNKDYTNLAGMVQRFLTGLLGIFITYNIYFLYSSPAVPSFIDVIINKLSEEPTEEDIMPKSTPDESPKESTSIFQSFIREIKQKLIDNALPLKVALTPLRIFMYAFEKLYPFIKKIPFKALLFILSGIATYYFLTKGASTYFVKMFGNSFKLVTDQKKYKHNETTTIIIAIATVYEICMLVIKYKSPVFFSPYAIPAWILFFGIAVILGIIAEFVIPLFVFYLTILCMMDNKESPFNFIKVISDINKSFVGESDDIYECPVSATDFEKLEIKFNKYFGKILLENIHIWVLTPIIIYNIYNAGIIKSTGVRMAHNLIGASALIALITTNKYVISIFKFILEKITANNN